MSGSEKNKILVLGRPGVPKLALARSVASDASEDGTAAADLSMTTREEEDEVARVEWLLKTRYYNASLEFWIDSTEKLATVAEKELLQRWLEDPDRYTEASAEEEDGQQARPDLGVPDHSEIAELQEHLSEVVDAVVFVFDPAHPDTFSDILPWARFAQKYHPEILLCVAATRDSDSKPVPEALKDKWFAWCVATGWEWVDLTDTDPETEYTTARIREALISNQWAENAQQQSGSTPPKGATSQDHSAGVAVEEDAAPDIETSPDGRQEWSQFDRVAGSVDSQRVERLHTALFADADASDMAGMLAQIQGMRDEISQLEPEQARIKAAELAMAVAKKL